MAKLTTKLILILLFLATALATAPLFAQEPIQVVSHVLTLSEDQSRALVAMLQTRETAVRPIAEELHARHEALAHLVQTATPDPAAVGRLVLEIRALETQAGAVARDAATAFEQVLTDEQRARLEGLRQTAPACDVLPAFRAAGLL